MDSGAGCSLFSEELADNSDELTGIQIVTRAIESPLRTIVENAGSEGSIVVAKVMDGKDNFGYDAKKEEYVDMLEASRQYQNNIEVISTIKALMLKTANLGK